MALTKVTKSGLADDSVDASKLEDGTIVAADINDGTITNDKLAGSIANAKLANSSITLNGSALALGGSASVLAFDWQSVVTTNTTMESGKGYFVDTTSSAITMTLPASPSAGDYVAIKDYAANFQNNSCTIGRNSSNIQGNANDSELTTTRASVVLVYVDGTKGWLYTNESNVAELQQKSYVTATGGTETTSGNFKIHTFNSSSNFVVSDGGNAAGSNKVSYLVIAGGGGGGGDYGGGAGAGGYREGRAPAFDSYTASPLVAPDGLSVTAQTYPITVGAGGTGVGENASPLGSNGSDSIFSTITSTGGGRGGTEGSSPSVRGGYDGGSGGGASYYDGPSNGSGNTPPVSPPQGSDGGTGSSGPPGYAGGGGGGATGPGGNAPSTTQAGGGGNGATTEISGSSVTRAGGGGGAGGGSHHSQNYTQGAGGPGGGGAGVPNSGSQAGNNGTANTGSGGSGIVIIRYKYQN